MKCRPGEVRDAIVSVLRNSPNGASVAEIETNVRGLVHGAAPSSVRSYLRLNTPDLFHRRERGHYQLREKLDRAPTVRPLAHWSPNTFKYNRALLYNADCIEWLRRRAPASIHGVVTDPPYGLVEYSTVEQEKLRRRRGGIWRLPPGFDGAKRAPLPRFTVLTRKDMDALRAFFLDWGQLLLPVVVPGAHVVVASNSLFSYIVSTSLADAGFERRGEIARLVSTMRGGDRPKAAHIEFDSVSVLPRSMWEPWLVFRKPIEGRVQDNLRKWKVGGFRRPSADKPFGDVIASAPTQKSERALAPHPSLKPQAFLRQIVRALLPLAEGIILDTFAGSGSTLAAADFLEYQSIGIERDSRYFRLACESIPRLAKLHKAMPRSS